MHLTTPLLTLLAATSTIAAPAEPAAGQGVDVKANPAGPNAPAAPDPSKLIQFEGFYKADCSGPSAGAISVPKGKGSHLKQPILGYKLKSVVSDNARITMYQPLAGSQDPCSSLIGYALHNNVCQSLGMGAGREGRATSCVKYDE